MKDDLTEEEKYELVKELIMKPFRSEDDIKFIKEWFRSLTWGEPIK